MPDTGADIKQMEKYLQRLAHHAWLPKDLLALAQVILHLQTNARTKLSLWRFSFAQESIAASDAHRSGQPLLSTKDFVFNKSSATTLWKDIVDSLGQMEGTLGQAAQSVQKFMRARENKLVINEAFAACLEGNSNYFGHWEAQLPETPSMIRFLAQASLGPSLSVATQKLVVHHDSSVIWEFGHCPHCGQLPYMGQLRGREKVRWHICSFCQLTYRVPRLQCPVCAEKNTDNLRLFVTDTEKSFEVHTCESCKNYIKVRNLSEMPFADAIPTLDDLESLPLDIMAHQQGYVRNTLSSWGF